MLAGSFELSVVMAAPVRPGNVPALAEWYFDSREWVLCARDAQGELHGPLRAYREDGTASLELEYLHGRREGPFRRFHGSGKLAQRGRYFDDVPDGLLSVYSDGESAHTIRECCILDAARVMRQEFRRGQLLAESFYDAQGELLPSAEGAFGARGWPQPLRERESDLLGIAFAFWPSSEVLPAAASELPVEVEQPLSVLRDAIQRAALRLHSLRLQLLARGAQHLPPDTSALAERAPPLRRFTFTTLVGEGASSVEVDVEVDETLPIARGVEELWIRAHLEWTLLSTLCWAAGSPQIELPERILARAELYAALLHASGRVGALSGHELEPNREVHFHDQDETVLPASALELLASHYGEIRAALLFAMDPECQSPWQDDLGRLKTLDRACLLGARNG